MAASMPAGFEVKRVYDQPEPGGGYRVLVDRLWPRGLSRDQACVELWARELAPSTALRRWYGHDPERFGEFRRRYEQELSDRAPTDLTEELRRRARRQRITLLTATRDLASSNATVVADYLSRS
jgi:uncharacterized protein YeaO (DUF488 family)